MSKHGPITDEASRITDMTTQGATRKEIGAALGLSVSGVRYRQDRLRGLIEQAMVTVGLDKVKLPTATLTVAKVNPKPVVTDEAEVPSIYWKQPDPVLDKTKINEDAKTQDIPGVSMTNGGTSLKIRRV